MMGLAKVGQRSGERETGAAVRKKHFTEMTSLSSTSAFVFLSICLKEEQDGGRANSDGFIVAVTIVK